MLVSWETSKVTKNILNFVVHRMEHIISPQIPVPPCATPGATQHPNDELFKVHRAAAVQVDFAPVAFQTTLRHVRRIWDLQDATDHLHHESIRGSETERKQRFFFGLRFRMMTYYYLITIWLLFDYYRYCYPVYTFETWKVSLVRSPCLLSLLSSSTLHPGFRAWENLAEKA